ncbi:MAG: ATP-binding protein [Treponema sp.]|jgi:predicted AAA+ superfamily ATPase|nr:ATP-binding protein [Treponema sp.]
MKRYLLEDLKEWKNSNNRKPLILYGARQVGKTWLLKEFGHNEYKQVVYLNFDDDKKLKNYFEADLDTARIISALESHFVVKITPDNTLIIFDELQECQLAKDSLKYFNENAPQYHIVTAGSFLGVAAGKFPVGQVNSLTLYPMSFYEFLEAIGRDMLVESIKSFDRPLLESLAGLLSDMLKIYYYVGGMPSAVDCYVQSQNMAEVREVQNEILQNYKSDFSKHILPNDIPKVRMLWDSIPVHLAREKKKFIYSDIKTGGRASEFENAMDWLVNTGLVYKVHRTLTPKLPLARDQEREAFKLFMLDTGLLCAKTNVDLTIFYTADPAIFHDFHGAMTEQYVCQELKATCTNPLFYWGRDKGAAEVDFIMQYKNEIIPIEVKSERQTQSKSLKVYMEEYNPKIAVRTSLKNIGVNKNLHSVPLYMLGSLFDVLEKKPK